MAGRGAGREQLLPDRGGGALYEHWPQRRADLGPDVVAEMEAGDRLSGREAGHIMFLRLGYQGRMLAKMHEQGIDMIVSPTEPITAPTMGTGGCPSPASRTWT